MSPTVVAVGNSNVVKSMDYDSFTGVLTVELASGARGTNVYQYAMVPEWLYTKFKLSRSKGQFFAKNIRSKFKTRKMVKQVSLVPA